MHSTQNFVIIVAAGKGLRMGSETKKQFLCLDKIPVLSRTIKVFDECDFLSEIVLVVPIDDHRYCREKIIDPYGFTKKIHLVSGGKQRQDSVFNGLKKVTAQKTNLKEVIVLIHDGVRPFLDEGLIAETIRSAKQHGACLPAVKITDTVKKVDNKYHVKETVLRQTLYGAQTPQTFKLGVIQRAFEYAEKTGFTGTDDASLVEHMGEKVVIIEGTKLNIKLTTPEDLVLGEFVLTQKSEKL